MGNDGNEKIIEEFRANHGVVRGIFEGVPVVLLRTTGARSGGERITPLVLLLEGGRLFVFASDAGAPHHPDWYHEPGRRTRRRPSSSAAIASAPPAKVIHGPERDRIVARQIELYPNFAAYQAKTARTIPVVELVRAR